ncbi:unnamed protein product [Pleuronectes platessa]|uniref:Uncharacterized protein n=1 Tax=Pleuronectes platessa TaxID=8262 RepID=A0A9N7UTV7_PLEPL|nr:unnamed protein product [Pleuronectes platessa]
MSYGTQRKKRGDLFCCGQRKNNTHVLSEVKYVEVEFPWRCVTGERAHRSRSSSSHKRPWAGNRTSDHAGPPNRRLVRIPDPQGDASTASDRQTQTGRVVNNRSAEWCRPVTGSTNQESGSAVNHHVSAP